MKTELSRRSGHLQDMNWSWATFKLQSQDRTGKQGWKGRLRMAMGACTGGSGSKEFAIPSPGEMEETKLTPRKDQHHVYLFGSGETCASNFSCLLCQGDLFPIDSWPFRRKGEKQKRNSWPKWCCWGPWQKSHQLQQDHGSTWEEKKKKSLWARTVKKKVENLLSWSGPLAGLEVMVFPAHHCTRPGAPGTTLRKNG